MVWYRTVLQFPVSSLQFWNGVDKDWCVRDLALVSRGFQHMVLWDVKDDDDKRHTNQAA